MQADIYAQSGNGISGRWTAKSDSSVDEEQIFLVFSSLNIGDTRRPSAEILGTLMPRLRCSGHRRPVLYICDDNGLLHGGSSQGKHPVLCLGPPQPDRGHACGRPDAGFNKTSFTGYMPLPVRHGMTIGRTRTLLQLRKQDRRGTGSCPNEGLVPIAPFRETLGQQPHRKVAQGRPRRPAAGRPPAPAERHRSANGSLDGIGQPTGAVHVLAARQQVWRSRS